MLAALALSLSIDPGPYTAPPCDPYRASSPSGRHFVEVVPSNRDGSGACHVLMGEAQRFVADEQLPLTLRDAAIDDAGDVIGWCSRNSWERERPSVFLRPHGERFRACPLPAEIRSESCAGAGLVLQPEHARALVRLDCRQDGHRREEWWPIALSSGTWGTRILPERLRPLGPAWNSPCFFQLLPVGARDALLAVDYGYYALYDADGRALWSLFDISAAFEPESEPEPVDELGPFQPGFTLRLSHWYSPSEGLPFGCDERLYRAQPECADLCVREVASTRLADLPGEPRPAFREIVLERLGDERDVEIPGGYRGAIELGAHDELCFPAAVRSSANAGPRCAATLADGARVWRGEGGEAAWSTRGDDPLAPRTTEFTRRSDDSWLRGIRAVAALDDGGLALLDGAEGWRRESHLRLIAYTSRGEPLEQYTLPTRLSDGLVARGDWICALDAWPCAAVLVRRSTHEVLRARLPGREDELRVLLPARAAELWLVDLGRGKLARYRLPAS